MKDSAFELDPKVRGQNFMFRNKREQYKSRGREKPIRGVEVDEVLTWEKKPNQ